MSHHCKAHWQFPRAYRYRVAPNVSGFGVILNHYAQHPPIGVAVIVGSFAYCLLWCRLGAVSAESVAANAIPSAKLAEGAVSARLLAAARR